jgi:hypothetical protein
MALANQYQLKLMIDLNQFDDGSNAAIWLDPLISPISGDEFFVATNRGRVFLARKNDINNQNPILDLPQSLNNSSFTTLTAISLHPSFTVPDVPGHATFYTAHTTAYEQSNSNNRLMINEPILTFTFETVITAWSYDFEKQQIAPQSQRELIRIPINSQDEAIKQLAFDPYLKPWHADYGQLYFSLGYSDELKQHALYSGAILRIHPMLFGARNYTVSETNPFLKDPEVSNEIVILGGHNIEHFFWTKYSHNTIFVKHNDNEKFRLSKGKVAVKLDSQPESNLLMLQAFAMPSIVLYQGRNILNLRNKMVYFTLLDGGWHLSSVSLESKDDELPETEQVITTEAITSPALTTDSDLSIHNDSQNEIIIFDRHLNTLYSLQLTKPAVSNTTENNNEVDILPSANNSDDSKILILGAFLIAVLISILLLFKLKNASAKDVLNKKFVRLEYVPTKNTFELFKRNSKKPHTILQLTNISLCEILLNNEVVSSIDNEPKNVIGNQLETEIREIFTKEQKRKIHLDQTREIQVALSDQNESYVVCLYLRKGNSRITGEKYHKVVDNLMELCWVISKQLNPQVIEKRIVPIAKVSRPILTSSTRKVVKPQTATPSADNKSNIKQERPKDSSTIPEQVSKNTELVDSLEKLVNLHKQGYLSDEEFSLAKANLLR